MTQTQPSSPVPRSRERLRAHYDIERELAERLLAAPRKERLRLYAELYTELFARVPDHPQITRPKNEQERLQLVDLQVQLLKRYLGPGTRFLEIGTGDGAVSRLVALRAAKVYAVDVTDSVFQKSPTPDNLEFVLSDGTSIPLPDGCCDVAYSHQLLEHLHPDDALEQTRSICRALEPGGSYVCLTPNALSGPHDVSQFFEDEPKGFHLREYTVATASQLMHEAGFGRVTCFACLGGRFYRVPMAVMRLVEMSLGVVPAGLRKRIARTSAMTGFLGAAIAARKPG